jgi:hypothetical protein
MLQEYVLKAYGSLDTATLASNGMGRPGGAHRHLRRDAVISNILGCDRGCLHVASLPPCHVLETPAGDVESLMQRHIGVLVATVQFLALVRRQSTCRVHRGVVIHDHVLTWCSGARPGVCAEHGARPHERD